MRRFDATASVHFWRKGHGSRRVSASGMTSEED